VTNAQRQIAKPAVLSCGYGTGGGTITFDQSDDEVKTGLWGYAESMGIIMSQQDAHDMVHLYRTSYPEVPRYWYKVHDVVKLLLLQHEPAQLDVGLGVKIGLVPGKLLYITLPSGRCLNYIRPALLHDEITFEGQNPMTHQWQRRRLYGSLIVENIVQAIARDVLAVGMVRAHEAGFIIVAHTHDELLCEVDPFDKRHTLAYLYDLMTSPIEWAAGLLIKADGWEGEVYRK
jgi:DNA polymerase